jgi:hypothetical protein
MKLGENLKPPDEEDDDDIQGYQLSSYSPGHSDNEESARSPVHGDGQEPRRRRQHEEEEEDDEKEEEAQAEVDPTMLSYMHSHRKQSEDDKWGYKLAIKPTSKFRLRWDALQAIVLFYLAISVPVRVGFEAHSYGVWYGIDITVDVYFWTDIFLNFFFAYEDGLGKIVYDLGRIRKKYLLSWFPIDLIASIPVDLIERGSRGTVLCSLEATCAVGDTEAEDTGNNGTLLRMVKLLRLLRLAKMLRLIKMAGIVQKYDIALFDAMPMINLSKIILVMLFLGHLFGSFFWFFSQDDWRTDHELEMIKNEELSTPWIDSQFPDGTGNATLLSKYIPSMYWAFTTMTTVGK